MSYDFANKMLVCPHCRENDPIIRKERIVGPQLFCSERNYSGCGVDIAECEQCLKTFQISYKVDEVLEI